MDAIDMKEIDGVPVHTYYYVQFGMYCMEIHVYIEFKGYEKIIFKKTFKSQKERSDFLYSQKDKDAEKFIKKVKEFNNGR